MRDAERSRGGAVVREEPTVINPDGDTLVDSGISAEKRRKHTRTGLKTKIIAALLGTGFLYLVATTDSFSPSAGIQKSNEPNSISAQTMENIADETEEVELSPNTVSCSSWMYEWKAVDASSSSIQDQTMALFDSYRPHFTLKCNEPNGIDQEKLKKEGKKLVFKNLRVKTPDGYISINPDGDPDQGHWRDYDPYGPQYYQFSSTMYFNLLAELALQRIPILDATNFEADWEIIPISK